MNKHIGVREQLFGGGGAEAYFLPTQAPQNTLSGRGGGVVQAWYKIMQSYYYNNIAVGYATVQMQLTTKTKTNIGTWKKSLGGCNPPPPSRFVRQDVCEK